MKRKIVIISTIVTVLISVIAIFFIINNKGKNAKICILEYNVNGGTPINSLDTKCGSKINEPSKPNKEGFDFLGWYFLDEQVNFDKFYLNENRTIEAKWKAKENTETVKIEFDTNGGNEIDIIEIAKGEKLTPPSTPKKKGYVFKYWSYNDKRFDFMNDINENLKLVAVWEKENEETNNSNSDKNNNDNNNSSNSTSVLKPCTYEIKDFKTMYNEEILDIAVGLDVENQWNPYFGFWDYDSSSCNIIYKTENSEIATTSSTGVIVGKKLGSTNINICVVDKTSNKELACSKFKAHVSYEGGSERALSDSKKLVNAINGHYWYLDGYDYAYLKVNVIDWYDHKNITWDSKFIELQNNEFITTEDTGIAYSNTANIQNKFLETPEYAYMYIVDYNMHVSSNKLYITLGSKTYSFTKSDSEKSVKVKLNVDKTDLAVQKGENINFDVKISPAYAVHAYAEYGLSVSSSDSSVVSNCHISGKNVDCYAKNAGISTLTITDSSGAITKVKVTVQKIGVTGISLNKSKINLERGKSENIIATISPSNAEIKSVSYTSSNPDVAKISSDGQVTAVSEGSATITATTDDGGFTATCIVNVTNPSLYAEGSIGYIIGTSSDGIYSGVSVEVSAKGGTGNYTYYYIKLYTSDGTLIGETNSTTSNKVIALGYKNGSYYAEFEVRDSNGKTYKGKTNIITISM